MTARGRIGRGQIQRKVGWVVVDTPVELAASGSEIKNEE
jgi:hypothetical protein